MKEKIKASLKSSKLDGKLMQKVKGGHCCCGCYYASSGGASTAANGTANMESDPELHSPGMCVD
ncbi:MAG: rSAM-modified peptide [Candidatus Aminicenantes bacterium]|nr:rSAM-modified peptide [Candidatus Aminicenantes bacterium]